MTIFNNLFFCISYILVSHCSIYLRYHFSTLNIFLSPIPAFRARFNFFLFQNIYILNSNNWYVHPPTLYHVPVSYTHLDVYKRQTVHCRKLSEMHKKWGLYVKVKAFRIYAHCGDGTWYNVGGWTYQLSLLRI